jgi:hypothetical protein
MIVDSYTKYKWLEWHHSMKAVGKKLGDFGIKLEIKYEMKICKWQSDRGEMESNDFLAIKEERHWTHQRSPSHIKEFNGGVERPIGVTTHRATCSLYQSLLPMKFIYFALNYTVFIENAAVHSVTGKIPCQQLPQPKSYNKEKFQPFGCLAIRHVPEEIRKGLTRSKFHKGEPVIFLGYDGDSLLLVYNYRTASVSTEYHIRCYPKIFPGLALKPHHLNPFQLQQGSHIDLNVESSEDGGLEVLLGNTKVMNDGEVSMDELHLVENMESTIPTDELRFDGELRLEDGGTDHTIHPMGINESIDACGCPTEEDFCITQDKKNYKGDTNEKGVKNNKKSTLREIKMLKSDMNAKLASKRITPYKLRSMNKEKKGKPKTRGASAVDTVMESSCGDVLKPSDAATKPKPKEVFGVNYKFSITKENEETLPEHITTLILDELVSKAPKLFKMLAEDGESKNPHIASIMKKEGAKRKQNKRKKARFVEDVTIIDDNVQRNTSNTKKHRNRQKHINKQFTKLASFLDEQETKFIAAKAKINNKRDTKDKISFEDAADSAKPPEKLHASELGPIPKTLREAISHRFGTYLKKAMLIELESLRDLGVYDEISIKELPKGRRLINSKWVYDYKIDPEGFLDRFKARLVAVGCGQVKDQDYKETYSPVVKMKAVRLTLALAMLLGLNTAQADIKTAFLHGILKERNFMRMPPGFEKNGTDNSPIIAELKKTLYGLHQASREFYKFLRDMFLEDGFTQLQSDTCMMFKFDKETKRLIIILIYVDDLLIASNSQDEIEKVKTMLSKKVTLTGNNDALDSQSADRKIARGNLARSNKLYNRIIKRNWLLGHTGTTVEEITNA